MRLGLATIIETVHTSTYCEHPETDHHIAGNVGCVAYTTTCSSKQAHGLANSQSLNHSNSDYECEDTMELDTRVASARLPIARIHLRVAPKSNIQLLLSTLHNTARIDHCHICHENIKAISILHPVDVKEAYSHSESCYQRIQWHDRSQWCCCASLGLEEDSVEGRLDLRSEGSLTEVVELLLWSDSSNGYGSRWSTYPGSVPDDAIVEEVGNEMDINPEDKTSYTTQNREAFLKYVENQCCPQH